MVPIKFRVPLKGAPYTVLVSVYAEDGTVAISHGGVEIGQGINTKVAQVAAMTLGIPMVMIQIKACSTLTSPNSIATGGSTTSELNCLVRHQLAQVVDIACSLACLQAVMKACQTLKDRMKPVKDKNPDASWRDLVALCSDQGIDLSAKFW